MAPPGDGTIRVVAVMQPVNTITIAACYMYQCSTDQDTHAPL